MATAVVTTGKLYKRYPVPLVAAMFLTQVALGLILFATFQDYVPRELGVSNAWPGYLVAAYGAGRFLFETPTGAISDRIERKFALISGLLLMLPAVALMGLISDPFAFLIGAGLLGLGTSFLWPATYAIAGDLYPADKRGGVIGFLNVGQLLGFGVGSLGGSQVIEKVTWEQFAVAFVAIALAAVTAMVGIPRYRAGQLQREAEEGRPTLKEVMSLRLILLALIVLATSTSLSMAVPAIRPFGTEELGVEFSTLTLALVPAIGVGVILYVPAGMLADRIGRSIPFLAGIGLMSTGLFWAASADTLWFAMIGAMFVVAGQVMFVPSSHAAVLDLAPETHRGVLIGLNVALTGLGLTIGPAISGPIVEAAGAPVAFRVAAFTGIGTAVALFAYSRAYRMGRPIPSMELD